MTNLNIQELDRLLDKTKTAAFLGENAAFLGALLCNLNFSWNDKIKTAQVKSNGTIEWNPIWFKSLEPRTRETILLHELWHVARLHLVRMEGKDMQLWNIACDIRINNDLTKEGRSFVGVENCHRNFKIDDPRILAEEEIYEMLLNDPDPLSKVPSNAPGTWGIPGEDEGDMDSEGDGETVGQLPTQSKTHLINIVANAIQQAKMSKDAGSIPGNIEEIVNELLKPKIPWYALLEQHLVEKTYEDYSWRRPSRRYQDIYMPIREIEGTIQNIRFYLDVSGSVTHDDLMKIRTELRSYQEIIKPLKSTVIQFDTIIQTVQDFSIEEEIDIQSFFGRGGTHLGPVMEDIQNHNPDVAVIFTDLECGIPKKPKADTDIFWIIYSNSNMSPPSPPPYGKTFYYVR